MLALTQNRHGRTIRTAAIVLANLLQMTCPFLHRCRVLSHQHLQHLTRKLLCRPARLGGVASAAADAEELHALSVVVAVCPCRKDDLRDAGTVNLLDILLVEFVWIGGVDISDNLHDSLVERVCPTVMDRADDVAGTEDGNGLGLNPIHDSDAILLKLLTKNLRNAATGLKHRVFSSLLELPEDLKPSLFGLLVNAVDDNLQRSCHLYGLLLCNLDEGSQIHVDGSSPRKPLTQLGIQLLKGLGTTNNRSTRNDVRRHLERKVQLWKTADQDLKILGTVSQKVNGGPKDGVCRQVRLSLLSLRVLSERHDRVQNEVHVKRHLVPRHRIGKPREQSG